MRKFDPENSAAEDRAEREWFESAARALQSDLPPRGDLRIVLWIAISAALSLFAVAFL